MASLNVFTNDAFSAITLTNSIEKVPYLPTGLGKLDFFNMKPIRTKALFVEDRQGVLTLIPFSERGEEGQNRQTEKRNALTFATKRLMADDTVWASEVQDVRAFGSETELMQMESEVGRRVSGPTGLQKRMEYTREYLRLAAVQGYVLDPKDSSVVYDLFAEFGIARPGAIAFNLAAGTPNSLRPLCNGIRRTILRNSQGAVEDDTEIVVLCGDAFYDAFVNHPDVIRTFVNWNEAREIRDGSAGAAFSSFAFGGLTFVNYRGSNDKTTIAVPANGCVIFPASKAVFDQAQAPGESIEWVNTPGKVEYLLPIPDLLRNSYWKMELYSYPLFMCTRPEVLLTGTM